MSAIRYTRKGTRKHDGAASPCLPRPVPTRRATRAQLDAAALELLALVEAGVVPEAWLARRDDHVAVRARELRGRNA